MKEGCFSWIRWTLESIIFRPTCSEDLFSFRDSSFHPEYVAQLNEKLAWAGNVKWASISDEFSWYPRFCIAPLGYTLASCGTRTDTVWWFLPHAIKRLHTHQRKPKADMAAKLWRNIRAQKWENGKRNPKRMTLLGSVKYSKLRIQLDFRNLCDTD